MAYSIEMFPTRTTLLVVAVLTAVAASLSAMARGPQFITVSANPIVSIETDSLQPGDVHFFAYRDRAGDQIRFLLARDSTGKIEGAFDACRRCSMYGEGYFSSHGNLVCRYCGIRYKLESMESGFASCVPVKLPFQTTGHSVNINSADLERERGLF
jgi:uncharacterized membrane protein